MAVPVDRSQVYEELAARHGGGVLRTKVDLTDLMTAAISGRVDMAIDGNGNFIFPDFQPVPDGVYAMLRLMQ